MVVFYMETSPKLSLSNISMKAVYYGKLSLISLLLGIARTAISL